MRFLCVSDIHGHARALELVLREADAYGWDQLIACGDLCFPGPDPLGVWKLLIQHRAVCVRGMSDLALSQIDPNKVVAATESEQKRLARLKQVHQELGELIIARLGKLPETAQLPLESGHTMLIVHGSPADPSEPFTFDMTDEELVALLGDQPGDLIVCGGSHVPFDRNVADVRIINVGSVGESPTPGIANAFIITTAQTGIAVQELVVNLEEASS